MRTRTRVLLVVAVLAVGVASLALAIARHGFSAREKPSWMEAMLARHARKRVDAIARVVGGSNLIVVDSLAGHEVSSTQTLRTHQGITPLPPDLQSGGQAAGLQIQPEQTAELFFYKPLLQR